VENGRVLVYCAAEKGNISQVILSLNQGNFLRVAQNLMKRVNVCIQENGENFQHLL
jgi:hypothetical protein